MANKKAPEGISEDTKTIVTVLLLIFAYPVGVIVMWVWTRWPIAVKILVSFLFIIAFIALFLAIIIAAINPAAQLKKAQQVQMMQQYQQAVTVTPTGSYMQQ